MVVVNADLVWAHNNLFRGEGVRKEKMKDEGLARKLLEKPHSYVLSTCFRGSTSTAVHADHASCSSISFYWAMDGKIPELNAHNIFLVSLFTVYRKDCLRSILTQVTG